APGRRIPRGGDVKGNRSRVAALLAATGALALLVWWGARPAPGRQTAPAAPQTSVLAAGARPRDERAKVAGSRAADSPAEHSADPGAPLRTAAHDDDPAADPEPDMDTDRPGVGDPFPPVQSEHERELPASHKAMQAERMAAALRERLARVQERAAS